MLTEDDFLRLVRDELRLPVSDPAPESLDTSVHWDSLVMLKLAAAVERRTGRRVAVGRLVRERNLRTIYTALTA